jgi:hypothetical protein
MAQVEIRIDGHLDKGWMDWLEGILITHTGRNQTLLRGSIQDQAALFGLILKLRDLGVKIVSIQFEDHPVDEVPGMGE